MTGLRREWRPRRDGADREAASAARPRCVAWRASRSWDLRDRWCDQRNLPHLQALYAELQDGQALIPSLKMGLGALTVQRWDPAYAAEGWTLYGAELTLTWGTRSGRCFTATTPTVGFCVSGEVASAGAAARVPALHPSKPELTSDCTAEEVASVVLDARSRIGTLVAVNAQIGSFVAYRGVRERHPRRVRARAQATV